MRQITTIMPTIGAPPLTCMRIRRTNKSLSTGDFKFSGGSNLAKFQSMVYGASFIYRSSQGFPSCSIITPRSPATLSTDQFRKKIMNGRDTEVLLLLPNGFSSYSTRCELYLMVQSVLDIQPHHGNKSTDQNRYYLENAS